MPERECINRVGVRAGPVGDLTVQLFIGPGGEKVSVRVHLHEGESVKECRWI